MCSVGAGAGRTGALAHARARRGLAVGLQSVVVPSYIAGVAPEGWAGSLGTANAAAILLGVLLVDVAGVRAILRPCPVVRSSRSLVACFSGVPAQGEIYRMSIIG